ncbi:hypothetical protein [Pseudomaricurvus sp. HS19]|uniref:hypothetical protein n=1 Tax=Pseudomaricurvus sp. HS19 TaxID=2692626 RepID=UPI00136AFEBF|nr:hypothetical protein [Pseudomaricurvus sp. HS19]MYM62257.1 hypothetical protein [Pseudomaricurvus sp. HS19]
MTTYLKTDKGREEIARPSGQLTPKQRRALILCNGTIDSTQLAQTLGGASAAELLVQLQDSGYITAAPGSTESPPKNDSNSYAEQLTALPLQRSAAEFEQAKNFMLNTIGHFHGQYGYLSLKSSIAGTGNSNDLRNYFAHWCESMEKTKQFQKLQTDLLQII